MVSHTVEKLPKGTFLGESVHIPDGWLIIRQPESFPNKGPSLNNQYQGNSAEIESDNLLF